MAFLELFWLQEKGKLFYPKDMDGQIGKIHNTPSTIFNIGSVTKQFTASSILKLLEQGKIKKTQQRIKLVDSAGL